MLDKQTKQELARIRTRRLAKVMAIGSFLYVPLLVLYMMHLGFPAMAAIGGGIGTLIFVLAFSALIYFWKGPII